VSFSSEIPLRLKLLPNKFKISAKFHGSTLKERNRAQIYSPFSGLSITITIWSDIGLVSESKLLTCAFGNFLTFAYLFRKRVKGEEHVLFHGTTRACVEPMCGKSGKACIEAGCALSSIIRESFKLELSGKKNKFSRSVLSPHFFVRKSY
jgi:hypothetical protein